MQDLDLSLKWVHIHWIDYMRMRLSIISTFVCVFLSFVLYIVKGYSFEGGTHILLYILMKNATPYPKKYLLFRWIFYSYGVFIHDEIKWIYGCEISKCHNLIVLCQAYLQKVVFENSPSDHKTWSLLMSCKNPCTPYIYIAVTYSVGPSSEMWSKLRPALYFPQTNENAWNAIFTSP